ncbi:hypothetical protein [Marinomonas fungiae]|uniref:Uncharacterized protein n=1 Tax=Marinomonas fungiae TaxID=1137284 RepID=A0A0K6IIE3_9GAMM|nr:hypothetical protein [Marinomonas fungiae]CUB02885.1 hypothetical protein Ga0061065_102223 [Marinomonas fungiae]
MREIKRQTVWQKSEHNAFTDLIRFQDAWWCTFREASTHTSENGIIRILKSIDGTIWLDMGTIRIQEADLRDPKLSISPTNTLVLLATALYTKAPLKYYQTFAWSQYSNHNWSNPTAVAEPNHWLWRITWQNGKAYGIAYGTPPKEGLYWYEFSSLTHYKSYQIEKFDDEYANEHDLAFDEQGNVYCLLRRDITPAELSTGLLGKSKPPYKQWEWFDLGFRIGGPALAWAPNKKTLLAGYRRHQDPNQWLPQWTEIAELSLDGKVLKSIDLESGGDCSYPGLALEGTTLKAVYYSSHEGQTKIYSSDIELNHPSRK